MFKNNTLYLILLYALAQYIYYIVYIIIKSAILFIYNSDDFNSNKCARLFEISNALCKGHFYFLPPSRKSRIKRTNASDCHIKTFVG